MQCASVVQFLVQFILIKFNHSTNNISLSMKTISRRKCHVLHKCNMALIYLIIFSIQSSNSNQVQLNTYMQLVYSSSVYCKTYVITVVAFLKVLFRQKMFPHKKQKIFVLKWKQCRYEKKVVNVPHFYGRGSSKTKQKDEILLISEFLKLQLT